MSYPYQFVYLNFRHLDSDPLLSIPRTESYLGPLMSLHVVSWAIDSISRNLHRTT